MRHPLPGAPRTSRSRSSACGPSGHGLSWRSPPKARATYHAPYPPLSALVSVLPGVLGHTSCCDGCGWRTVVPSHNLPVGSLQATCGAAPQLGGRFRRRAMVRSVADRAFLPAKSLFEQVGDMMILTAKTVVSAVRPPYPYGGEFIGQFLFALQLCWFPMMI